MPFFQGAQGTDVRQSVFTDIAGNQSMSSVSKVRYHCFAERPSMSLGDHHGDNYNASGHIYGGIIGGRINHNNNWNQPRLAGGNLVGLMANDS